MAIKKLHMCVPVCVCLQINVMGTELGDKFSNYGRMLHNFAIHFHVILNALK